MLKFYTFSIKLFIHTEINIINLTSIAKTTACIPTPNKFGHPSFSISRPADDKIPPVSLNIKGAAIIKKSKPDHKLIINLLDSLIGFLYCAIYYNTKKLIIFLSFL
jgi:hypothetical protein